MNLICCSCGGEAPSRRQWWNRDRGYGICPGCFKTWVKKLGVEEAIRCCGVPGIHHTITDKPITPEPKPKPRHYNRDFDEADCSGVFDGFGVVSDADPGL